MIIPYKKGNLLGYCDENKNILIEPKFESASLFFEGLAVVRLNGKRFFVDQRENILNLDFDDVQEFKDGFCIFKQNNRAGICDRNFNVIIPATYKLLSNFQDGFASFHKEENVFGVTNLFGKEKIYLCSDISNVKNGFLILEDKDDNNKSFMELVNVDHKDFYFLARSIEPLSEGVFAYQKYGLGGYLDVNGKENLTKFKWVSSFKNGLAKVCKKFNEYYFINHSFDLLTSKSYYSARSFSESLAAVSIKHTTFGYINTLAEEVVPFIYEDANNFSDGIAAVKLNNKWGYINKKGEFIIEPKYQSAHKFIDGLALVSYGKGLFFINKNGTEFTE